MFDATYVINLDRSPERWAAMQRVLVQTGLRNVIRLPGVDGQRLEIAALQAEGVLSQELAGFDPACRTAEIGCGVSHAGVLGDILARGFRHALVLEDDVVPTGAPADWPARARAAFADLPADWDLWYLFRCLDVRPRVQRVTPRTVIPWAPQSAAAYAVSAAGARTLLAAITPLTCAVDRAYMEVVKARRLACFAASPMLFDPGLGSQPSVLRAAAPSHAFIENGINRPPEYWPARYLAHLGEAPTVASTFAEWWYRGTTMMRRFWSRGERGA